MARRQLALVRDAAIYGVPYGYLRYLIDSLEPLDPERTWQIIALEKRVLGDWIGAKYPPSWAREWLLARKRRQDARLGIAEHYDVSNDFYELFLDRKYMFYSCADFHGDRDTLEDAQTHKADFILKLIDPHPGEKILELGCGWGPMLKRILEATGDKQNLTGYTLSQEQVRYNVEHNGFHVEFRNFVTTEYPERYFDKIYSIGAWEHVRPHEAGPLMAKLHAALKPGGRVVHHFLCRLNDPLPAAAVVSQLFFPGSINSSLRFHAKTFEAAGFRIAHLSVHDYRPTLRAWFDNLVANRERALELVGIPTFNRYLVFFAASWRYFDDFTGAVFRFILMKRD
jgi:cyclopropane-fatty-acyl-phospholipid synthase